VKLLALSCERRSRLEASAGGKMSLSRGEFSHSFGFFVFGRADIVNYDKLDSAFPLNPNPSRGSERARKVARMSQDNC
jgi:hypothetical protein